MTFVMPVVTKILHFFRENKYRKEHQENVTFTKNNRILFDTKMLQFRQFLCEFDGTLLHLQYAVFTKFFQLCTQVRHRESGKMKFLL